MIFSSIHANDDLKRYPIAIQKAIEYAKTTDFAGLEDGKHEIDGEQMFVNLFHLTSKPKEETHPELHKRYADVQFWICGEGFAALRRSLVRASVSTRVKMTTCISTMVLRTSSSSMRRKDAMQCFSRMTHTAPACAWMVSRLIIARRSSR